MLNQLLRYFLSGLAILIPIWGTFYILFELISWIDSWLGLDIPGVGLLIVVVIIINIGVLAKIFLGRSLVNYLDRIMRKIPFVAIVYNIFKEITDALMGEKKKFDKPVLVTFQEDALYRLGYMTQDTIKLAGMENQPLVAVYLPHSYNFSGNVYLVNPLKVKALDIPSGELMKFIVSGGVVENPKKESIEKGEEK